MTTAEQNYEDDFSDYDDYEDEEEEGGLSGFSVLMIGLLMLGAFATTTYVFYQRGIRQGERRAAIETPFVAADPEPIKIETANAGAPVEDREVYDVFDGEDPEPVTVIAEGPEEPVERTSEDTIAALAADVSDEIDDRVASLEEEDAAAFEPVPAPAPEPTPKPATQPTPASAMTISPAAASAVSGTHVVQVGAFRSDEEALAQWSRMQKRLGAEVIGGKTYDIERADLGDRGVYHRLRVGPFSSADAAKDYCATLKENGQDCLAKGI